MTWLFQPLLPATAAVQSAGPVTVTPTAGVLRITGIAPTVVGQSAPVITPSAGTLRVVGIQPTVAAVAGTSASPTAGTLRLVGVQPTVVGQSSSTRTPTAGTLRVVGIQPTVVGQSAPVIAPSASTLRVVGQQPTVSGVGSVTCSPSAGTLRLSGQVPDVSRRSELLVSFGTPASALSQGSQSFLVLVRKTGTGTPTISISLYEDGSLVSLLVSDQAVTSSTGETIEATWAGSDLADPTGADVECFIESVGHGGSEVEIGAVNWDAQLDPVPSAGTLRLVGTTPTIAVTAHQYAAPTAGTLRLAGQTPTVDSVPGIIRPSTGVLRLAGQTPLVVGQSAPVITPAAGTLRLVGIAPTTQTTESVTGPSEVPAGRGRARRRYVVEVDGRVFEVNSPAEAVAILAQAKALAVQAAEQAAEQVVTRQQARRVGKAIRLKAPTVTGSPELAAEVMAAQTAIARIYREAAMAAEIRLLMALQAERDDEEVMLLAM